MLILKIAVVVLLAIVIAQAIYMFLLRRKNEPSGNLWATFVFDKDLNIIKTINIESATLLEHTVDNIKGININDLQNYVTEREKTSAQNIAREITKVANGNGEAVHFEFIVSNEREELQNVMCLAEKLPNGRVLCHIMRTEVRSLIEKESFVDKVLRIGVNNISLGICIRYYSEDKMQEIFANDVIESLFFELNADMSGWNANVDISIDLEISQSGIISEEIKHLVMKNGKEKYIRVKKRRFIDSDKRVFVFSTYVDLTELVKKKSEAEEARSNLEMAIDAGRISAWTFDVKTQWSYGLYGNPFSQKGTSLQDMIQSVHEDDQKDFREALNSLISSQKERVTIQFRYRDPIVGEFRYIESKMMAYKSEQGQVLRINGIQVDVTAAHKMQELHKTLVGCLEKTLIDGGSTIWFYDVSTKKNRVVLGDHAQIDDNIITPMVLKDLKYVNSTDSYIVKLKKVVAGEIDSFIHFGVAIDGRAYEYSVSNVRDSIGNIVFIVGMCRDVTSYNNQVEQFANSNKCLRAIFDELPVGVEFYNTDDVLVDVNKRVLDIYGVNDIDTLLEKNLKIYDNENFTPEIRQKLIQNECHSFIIDYDFNKVRNTNRFDTVRNDVVKLEFTVQPIAFNDGSPLGKVLLTLDVTKSQAIRRANEELMNQQEEFMNGLPVGFEMYDIDGNWLESNLFDKKLFVGPLKKDAGYNFNNDPHFSSEILSSINTGVKFQFSIDYSDSELVPDLTNLNLTYDAIAMYGIDKQKNGFMFIVSDETERTLALTEANKRIENLNRINEMILENLQVGLVFLDNDFKVVWENMSVYAPKNKEACMYKTGTVCYESVKGLKSPCKDCLHVKSLKSGKTETREVDFGGEPFEVSVNPVFEDNGKRNGSVIRSINIIERKKVVQRLHEARIKAEQADKLKSAFLANMSHEIRTPLNSIIGFADLIKTTEDQEAKAECSRIINTNSEILLNLINDILDLSKIEAGVIELCDSRFNANQLFKEMALSFEIRAPKDVKIICDVPKKQYDIITDKNRITQVITNFMSNSIKFTSSGSITLKYELKEGGIKLSVADTGIGISSANLLKVFDRFQKLNTNIQGTGLGLPICKTIVESLGGKVGVESELGVGSIFWAYVPCEVIETVTTGQPAVEGKTNSHFKKLLVAEDNDHNFLLVSMMLDKTFDIERAENGQQAVDLARKNHYDFILMDIKMPIMDGIEATKKIREFDSEIPIIALTAFAFDTDKEKAMSAGCNAFLTKPLKRNDLDRVLHDL